MNSKILLLTCICAAAMLSGLKTVGAEAVTLTPVWELSGFRQPESVIYDVARDVLYVSNIDGDPADKDGKVTSHASRAMEKSWKRNG